MPSLWDLLCVSRQHKYATHTTPPRHPHSSWDHAPHQDHSSTVEYYIQPDIPFPRRADPFPARTSAHPGNIPPSKLPSSRRKLKVHESPAAPRDGSNVVNSGQQNVVDRRSWGTASTGRRRHVKDIFADVSPQSPESSYRSSVPSTASVAESAVSIHREHSERTSLHSPGQRHSAGYAQRPGLEHSSRSWQISASRDTPGFEPPTQYGQTSQNPQSLEPRQSSSYMQRLESRHHAHPRESAQCRHVAGKQHVQSRQASAHPPAVGSWQSSGLSPTAGSRPSPRLRPPESMHQYSPRTVSDSAISAALFGGRIDDFVHDPGWNKAINRFAASPASPTSPSTFSFEDKSFPHPANRSVSSQRKVSPKDSDGNVTFVVAARQPKSVQPMLSNNDVIQSENRLTSQPPHMAAPVDRSERIPSRQALAEPMAKQSDVFSRDMIASQDRDPETGYQINAGSGSQDFPLFSSPEEDVLY